jgi:hypothetical protein
MQVLMLFIIVAVTTALYLASIHVAPSQFKFLPEALSALVAAFVIVAGPLDRFRLIAARYWLVFAALAVVMVCGVLANAPAPGVLIGNGRYYLRAIPLFFLPALINFSETQLRTQLRLLLGISVLQLPFSLHQRYVIYSSSRVSGDDVIGTLMNSAALSIFLIGVICVAAALTLRERISKPAFLLLFVLLIIPTTINETKATVFLLPIGLISTLFVGAPPRKRLQIGVFSAVLMLVFAALFVPIYDFFSQANNKYPYTLESFFTNKKEVEHYLDQGTDVGSRKEAGRIDSVEVPLQAFLSEPVHLLLGVGVGNGSISTLGNGYTGEYQPLYGRYTAVSSAAAFLVEIGLIGLALVFMLDWLVFRDALFVARHDRTLIGAVALGWVGTTVVMVISTFYKDVKAYDSLSYLFWYFSGVIAATRMRLELQAQAASVNPGGATAHDAPTRRMRFLQ